MGPGHKARDDMVVVDNASVSYGRIWPKASSSIVAISDSFPQQTLELNVDHAQRSQQEIALGEAGDAEDRDLEIGPAVAVDVAFDQRIAARELVVQFTGLMMEGLFGDEVKGLIASAFFRVDC